MSTTSILPGFPYDWDFTEEDTSSGHDKLALIDKIKRSAITFGQNGLPVVVRVTLPDKDPGWEAYQYEGWLRYQQGMFVLYPNSKADPLLAYANGRVNGMQGTLNHIRLWSIHPSCKNDYLYEH